MTLNKQQFKFTQAVGLLITYAYFKGYTLSFGDALAKDGHSKNSFHYKRLAIDFNLFKDGEFLTETKDHQVLGEYWELLGGSWGGSWGDGNHYSWCE